MRDSFVARARHAAVAGIAIAAVVFLRATAEGQTPSSGSPKYPASPKGGQIDDLGGIRIPDPYRWLEAPSSPDVRAWVAAQNALSESFLSQIARRREIQDLTTREWNYTKVSAPFAAAERMFYFENSGLENQRVLYTQDRTDPMARVLLDANAFSNEGLISIVAASPSPDGRYLAYTVSAHGSSWLSVRVRDLRTGQDVGEELRGIRDPRLAWTKDERGFFYVRVEQGRGFSSNPLVPDGKQRVFYHRVGRSQSDDQVIYEDAPSTVLRADVSDDGQYLVITSRNGTELQNRLAFIDLDNPKRPNLAAPIVKLFDNADAVYEFVANEGNVFFVRTTKGAARGRLVGVDINMPDANYWTTIIRETFDVLTWVRRVDDRFVVHRLHDAHSELTLHSLDGGPRGTVPMPGVGTVTELRPRPELRDFYFTFTSFLQPPSVYRYDLDARVMMVYKETRPDTSLARWETTQLFYTSKDGTRVPMFITARRGINLDGSHPTLLAGAPGFNVSMTPTYSPEIAAWLALGGIYAVPNVRGGGEDGRAWHDVATGSKKSVAVDDFLAAADFLIDQRYTRAGSIAVTGHDHGAMLAAAAMLRRPELFGAALLDEGVFDLARFNRFTVGASWTPEYGSPDRSSDLQALLAYSPLHVADAERTYPATLITVGDRDDVVPPIHSYKLAATLQASQRGPAPILLRADYDMGFGTGAPTSNLKALSANRLAFLVNALHLPASR
jgi:prolyl oligopeptidase